MGAKWINQSPHWRSGESLPSCVMEELDGEKNAKEEHFITLGKLNWKMKRRVNIGTGPRGEACATVRRVWVPTCNIFFGEMLATAATCFCLPHGKKTFKWSSIHFVDILNFIVFESEQKIDNKKKLVTRSSQSQLNPAFRCLRRQCIILIYCKKKPVRLLASKPVNFQQALRVIRVGRQPGMRGQKK